MGIAYSHRVVPHRVIHLNISLAQVSVHFRLQLLLLLRLCNRLRPEVVDKEGSYSLGLDQVSHTLHLWGPEVYSVGVICALTRDVK